MSKACIFLVLIGIYAVAGLVVIPPDVIINCSGSTLPSATGWATKDGVNQVFAQSSDDNSCRLQITRYWRDASDNSDLGTQIITVKHAIAPVIVQPPISINYVCDGTGDNMNNLINNDVGGSVVNEPCGTAISVSNDYVRPSDAHQCYWYSTVTYTFSNLCGESVTATANYGTVDVFAPTFTSPPQSASVACSADTNSQFQDWLANGGGATLTSGCLGTTGLSFLHDFTGSVACGQTYTVNFRSTNICGTSGDALYPATFTVAPPPLPTRQSSAEDITLSFENTVNNNYATTYELPADWQTIDGILNPLWYHVPASNYDRSIIASTCSTPVDTLVAILVPGVDGSLSGVHNDDRVDSLANCDILSSYIQYNVPAYTDFYVVVASFSEGGDIDLHIYQEAATCEQLITEAESDIISSLSYEINSSASNLAYQVSGVANLVSQNEQ